MQDTDVRVAASAVDQACGVNMDKLVPALLVHLDASRDADVRLAFLALLETMLGTDAIAHVRSSAAAVSH